MKKVATNAEKLALAVIWFHQGSPWTETRQKLWREITGTDDATSKSLCDFARRVLVEELER